MAKLIYSALKALAEHRFGKGAVHVANRATLSRVDQKLAAVRLAYGSSFPTADIETMLEESTRTGQPPLHG